MRTAGLASAGSLLGDCVSRSCGWSRPSRPGQSGSFRLPVYVSRHSMLSKSCCEPKASRRCASTSRRPRGSLRTALCSPARPICRCTTRRQTSSESRREIRSFSWLGESTSALEVFGNDRVRAIRDLKGKTVAVPLQGGPQQVFLSTIAAYIGLNPHRDIKWGVHSFPESMRLLSEGKVDAFLGFPPQPHELRRGRSGMWC